ncbi:MAG: AmmeMemoRadiSam system protein B [Lentisphaerae bacterium]|nr:AmmeMemoRadiSam system protein B [Lentisphaerota bacterium]
MPSADRHATHTSRGQGRWFPADPMVLQGMVDDYLEGASIPAMQGPLAGAIAPHAGYVYSGAVAGHTYRAIRDAAAAGRSPDTVVVLGFSHRETFPGVALLGGAALRTPLGMAALDIGAGEALTGATRAITWQDAPHAGEHSAENQVPFLQRALPAAKLVIGLFGEHGAATITAVSDALLALGKTRRLLVVASTDLLHDPDHAMVARTDRETLSRIMALDAPALDALWRPDHQVCCGIGPVLALLRVCRARGCREGVLLRYRNSGDDHPESRGSWVVGYGAVAFPVAA